MHKLTGNPKIIDNHPSIDACHDITIMQCSQSVENFVGVSTDGSETGIYELVQMVQTGVLVAFGLAVVVAGFFVGRKILRYVRGAG